MINDIFHSLNTHFFNMYIQYINPAHCISTCIHAYTVHNHLLHVYRVIYYINQYLFQHSLHPFSILVYRKNKKLASLCDSLFSCAPPPPLSAQTGFQTVYLLLFIVVFWFKTLTVFLFSLLTVQV